MSARSPGFSADMPKEEIERLKLYYELVSASRPFWKLPTFWAAVIPLVITAAGAWEVWRGQYFENQQNVLKIETSALDERRTQLETDIAVREEEIEDLREQFEAAQAKAERAEKDYVAQAKQLDQKLRAQEKAHRERIVAFQSGQQEKRVRDALESLLAEKDRWNLSQKWQVEDLSNQLALGDQYREMRWRMVREALERQDTPPEARVVLAYILFRAAPQKRWVELIAATMKETVARDPDGSGDRVLAVVGPMRIEGDAAVIIQRQVLESFRTVKLGGRLGRSLCFALTSSGAGYGVSQRPPELHKVDREGFLAAVAFARSQLFDKDTRSPYERKAGAFFLTQFAPQAYAVYLGRYFTSPELRISALDADLTSDTIHMRSYTLKAAQVPEGSDPVAWKGWLDANSGTAAHWLQADLKDFRASEPLLAQELAKWR